MRYILKQNNILNEDESKKFENSKPHLMLANKRESEYDEDYLKNNSRNTEYLKENWEFQIRRINYDDAGTYQCLLSLATPITRNITLQVIRKLFKKKIIIIILIIIMIIIIIFLFKLTCQ